MADAPGKETQPDPQAVGKTGPVKPPVLEGTARPTKVEDKPAAKPEAPKAANKPEPPKPAPKPAAKPAVKRDDDEGGGAPWLAGILGGALGLGAAYGLAFFGMWPSQPVAPPAADPRLAQIASAVPELQTVTNTVQDELATLNGRVSGLENSVADLPTEAAAPSQDFSAELAALSERVEALASAPAPEANSDAVDALRAELQSLSTQIAEAGSRLDATETQVATLAETATQQADQTDVARLPLIFSGLESAFAAGRPFETELAALEQAAPDAEVPNAVAGAAGAGLPRPDDVARRLDLALPDMLAGRPVSADAGWQDATADWFRGVIAMRPAGDVEGTSPDAVVARLEAAVARRDFAAASAEMEALPELMRNAAGGLNEDIAALAAASSFLDGLRSQAIGGGTP